MPTAEYLLPLRWNDDRGLDELTAYLRQLSEWIPVAVVDGSDDALFAVHRAAWPGLLVRHIRPDGSAANGKADGVLTGVRASSADVIVIADDDVRYTRAALHRALASLADEDADLLRPQNYFDPLPWHARWDTARSLINRAFGSDFPGTLVVRRSALLRAGGYDGDVLFENLELIRTIEASGGRVVRADDLFVRRLPPTARQFVSQRVRQAYDSRAQPTRMAVELSLLPLMLAWRRRPGRLFAFWAAAIAVAEVGRRRAGGTRVFAPTAAAWAPLWVLERAITSWVAVGEGTRGGVRYRGKRMRVAAHSRRRLTRERRHDVAAG